MWWRNERSCQTFHIHPLVPRLSSSFSSSWESSRAKCACHNVSSIESRYIRELTLDTWVCCQIDPEKFQIYTRQRSSGERKERIWSANSAGRVRQCPSFSSSFDESETICVGGSLRVFGCLVGANFPDGSSCFLLNRVFIVQQQLILCAPLTGSLNWSPSRSANRLRRSECQFVRFVIVGLRSFCRTKRKFYIVFSTKLECASLPSPALRPKKRQPPAF